MNELQNSRRELLRTLMLGAAGATLAACGGKPSGAPAESSASGAASPAPAAAPAPAPEPAATPAPAATATPAPAADASSGALPPVAPNDTQALALGYHADAATVDPAKNATFKAGQHCATCVQYKGKPGDSSGPCGIFVGKSVAAAGWCKVWAAKPA